ncbi:hypothetical protein [Nocardioides campestrisoli]|uniref:hypothetical protein n=1 Tax=Nocardioides campestrisoli TaxID=2736757 RepID=UPI0015E76341|nr:hypothetical protein [Nocardioides campestrisoli]
MLRTLGRYLGLLKEDGTPETETDWWFVAACCVAIFALSLLDLPYWGFLGLCVLTPTLVVLGAHLIDRLR